MGNTPNIRFKGFTGEWEQCKLEDYLSVSKQKNRDEQYDKEDVLSVSGDYGIVNQIEFQGRSFAGASVANYGVVETGDVVYTKSPLKTNPYGIIKTNKGNTGIVSTLYAVYKPKENVDSEFVQIYFEQDTRMNSYMHPLVNKGAKNDMKVSAENALKGEIIFPKAEEQRRISAYFNKLDHLITLHQQKCEQAKKLKKFMLQKMFPKKEEKKPKIRFEGFTEEWEQRKLGEVLNDLYNGQTPSRSKNHFWKGNINWLSSGELNRGIVTESIEKITSEGQESAHLRLVPSGTFVMAITGLEATGTRGNCAILGIDTTLNQSCMALFPNDTMLDTNFLFQWYRMIGEDYGIRFTQGTKQQSYNAEIIKDLDIILPKVDEQKKIADYLWSIDNLITLHQRKCDELQKIKKFMLQNMFA